MTADALSAALDYAQRGWRVLPIKPGMKRPPMSAWQDAATTDTEILTSWWTGLYADHGIGVCAGEQSGVFIVDIDCAGGKTGYDSWRDLLDTYGEIPEGPCVITPSGGMHLYFQWPQGRRVGTNAARLGQHIDVRGEGGQCVAPPTVIGGNAYQWEADTFDLPLPEAPEWLLELLTAPEPAPAAQLPRTPIGDGDGPIARYNAAISWDQLLRDDGWSYVKTDRAGHAYWLRPELGHPHTAEWSASVGHAGVDLLHCFTSTVPWLEVDRSYNKFQYYARRQFNGDEKAAARQILDDEGGTTKLKPFRPMIEPAAPGDPWPAPIPLGGQKQQLPTFPTHVFPDWIAQQAHAVAVELQMQPDLPANLALIALATIAAKATSVNVAGKWVEPLNVYIAVAMPPSAGKSPAFNFMTGPIRRHEEKLAEDAASVVEFKAQTKRMIEKRMAKAEAADDRDEARMALTELLELGELTAPRLTADDATPEALVQLLAEQGGKIAILSTEGGLFDLMTGRYSEKANLDVYLKSWSGDTITVDRIGRGQSKVANPALTIGLTVQPSVIAALAEKPELAGRGLTARFMYALPIDNVGHRDFLNPAPSDPAVARTYDQQLTALATQLGATTNAQIVMDEPAHKEFLRWKQELEERRLPDGELRPLAEWSTKLESTTIRVAGLLHLAHGHGANDTLTIDTVRLAIEVGNYWIAHAQAVHDMWGRDPMLDKARIILEFAKGMDRFTTRDLYSKRRAAFPRADETIGPLSILIERGWLRPVDNEWPPSGGGRGQRTPELLVHPSVARHARVARPEMGSEGSKSDLVARHVSVVLRDITEITHSLTTQEHGEEDPPAQLTHDAQLYPQAEMTPTGTDWLF